MASYEDMEKVAQALGTLAGHHTGASFTPVQLRHLADHLQAEATVARTNAQVSGFRDSGLDWPAQSLAKFARSVLHEQPRAEPMAAKIAASEAVRRPATWDGCYGWLAEYGGRLADNETSAHAVVVHAYERAVREKDAVALAEVRRCGAVVGVSTREGVPWTE